MCAVAPLSISHPADQPFPKAKTVTVVTRVRVRAVPLHVAHLAAVEALTLEASVLPCTEALVALKALEGLRALELAAVRSSLQRTLSTFLLVEALVP